MIKSKITHSAIRPAVPPFVILQLIFDLLTIIVSAFLADKLLNREIILDCYQILIVIVCFLFSAIVRNMYQSIFTPSTHLLFIELLKVWVIGFGSGVIIHGLISSFKLSWLFLLLWFVFTVVLFYLFYKTAQYIAKRLLRQKEINIAFIDNQLQIKFLAKDLKNIPWKKYNIVGFYSSDDNQYNEMIYKGNIEQLLADAKKGLVDEIYVADSQMMHKKIEYIIQKLADTTCSVMLLPNVFTFNLLRSRIYTINDRPVISIYDTPFQGLNAWIKRVEDIIGASIILMIISPLLLLIAIIIKLTSKGPILFKQDRYGINGKIIKVWKFRSMKVMENGDNVKQVTKGDARLTPVGAFLRRTSLDELPQFLNVLWGDMSIVGPRPHAIVHNEYYRTMIMGYMLRHKVKPGITGWAQINGYRGETDTIDKMQKRIEYDLEYIHNWSISFDIKIILLTIVKGFISKTAY